MLCTPSWSHNLSIWYLTVLSSLNAWWLTYNSQEASYVVIDQNQTCSTSVRYFHHTSLVDSLDPMVLSQPQGWLKDQCRLKWLYLNRVWGARWKRMLSCLHEDEPWLYFYLFPLFILLLSHYTCSSWVNSLALMNITFFFIWFLKNTHKIKRA